MLRFSRILCTGNRPAWVPKRPHQQLKIGKQQAILPKDLKQWYTGIYLRGIKELEQFYERLHEIPLSRSDCTESQPNFEQIDQWNRSVSTLIKEQIATEKANELSNLSRYKANYEKAVEIEQFYQKSFEEMLANRNLFITEENFDEKYQESMKNIVDYNYAINKSGEKIKIGHK
ncbi:MAG: Mitochondrial ribosome subunit S26, variant 2 [Marteilia pararefringens]